MGIMQRTWNFIPAQEELASELSRELGLTNFIAQSLINRGITDVDEASCFLYGDEKNLGDPFLLKNMAEAVERIFSAIHSQQKIIVYGDYDVDGITACAILYKMLKQLGANAEYYIPDRQTEGYGLNAEALENLINTGCGLLITVDCGISSVREVEDVSSRLDIIITDHHQPPPSLPPAYAIINPKQEGCVYPDKNLAGVGVAFKLCQALRQSENIYNNNNNDNIFSDTDYLEIVALGTIADIVPLVGENRILVKLGLKSLEKTTNIGLKELITICSLTEKKIDSGAVGYILAPRLNAAGRVNSANNALSLLITEDLQEANKLAGLLNKDNSVRQSIEKEILGRAEEELKSINLEKTKVLVLSGEDWHVGVIGIVASRLVEKYYRPVVMISFSGDIGTGSCRSIAAFDIYAALKECSELLTRFGGHHQAAGLTISRENIDKFREMLNDIALRELTPEDYIPVLNIDALIPLEEIDFKFLEQLSCLSPHGFGNSSPVFAAENINISDIRVMGQDSRHLKLKVKKQNSGHKLGFTANNPTYTSGTFDVVAWDWGGVAKSFRLNECIDLVFYPKYNEWQGNVSIQLVAHDLRLKWASAKKKASDQEAFPDKSYNNLDRDVLGKIYLLLKKDFCRQNLSFLATTDIIADKLYERFEIIINPEIVEKALVIFKELNLLWYKLVSDRYHIHILPAPAQKLSLTNSPTYRQLF